MKCFIDPSLAEKGQQELQKQTVSETLRNCIATRQQTISE
jgi:hypothetical protein